MDWNWFFSSLAQSSAAIVGIFAAFIITKIINNQAEFERKRMRLRELNAMSEYLKDSFSNRNFGIINRTQLANIKAAYTRRLEKDPFLEPEPALQSMPLWPHYTPYPAMLSALSEAREEFLEEQTRLAKQSTVQRMLSLSSSSVQIGDTSSLKGIQERDAVSDLIAELRQHIRVCKLHLNLVSGNPEKSVLVERSVYAAGLLFFFGVGFPLSFLRVANDLNPIISGVGEWFSSQLNIKGLLLLIVSIIFLGILTFFVRANNLMFYEPEEIETLETNLEFNRYSSYLKIRSDNEKIREEKAKPVQKPTPRDASDTPRE